ncbi:zinc-finger homeodomain protein 8-like [Macadamia integrifolia]|uniref:zinc-finger homeodomain protein 8-like n=1 Tax=Macadamia integrifolia TaxID=60698 RepID=UPI001C4F1329|nr:zinc-finger homeodomain protein 8-like [Macadamia integrifolia]
MAVSPKDSYSYRECMRNHAVRLGKTITDGCGEFMLNENTPNFLLCEACGCHRSFHRKIPYIGSVVNQGDNNQQRTEQVVAVQAVHDGERGQEQQQMPAPPPKRVRTAFTREQKARMRIFSEDLQWMMVRNRSYEIDSFCHEIGVPRQNFRTWMQNHKHTSTSLELASMAHPEPASASSGSRTPNIASSSLALAL